MLKILLFPFPRVWQSGCWSHFIGFRIFHKFWENKKNPFYCWRVNARVIMFVCITWVFQIGSARELECKRDSADHILLYFVFFKSFEKTNRPVYCWRVNARVIMFVCITWVFQSGSVRELECKRVSAGHIWLYFVFFKDFEETKIPFYCWRVNTRVIMFVCQKANVFLIIWRSFSSKICF